jgi:hypothetical protein
VAATLVIRDSRETYAWVVPQSGPLAGRVYPVQHEDVLGSDPRCHVVLEGIAARAARLSRRGKESWLVHALGGPVEVAGHRLATTDDPWLIGDGDQLQLGNIVVVFKCVAD